MMAVPMLSIVIPHWSLPLLPLPGSAASALTSVGARTTIRAASDRLPATTPITIPVAPAGRDRVPIVAANLPEQPAAERSISGILAQVWLFGFLVCLAVVAFGLFGLHRLAHRATRIANPQWLTLLASLKRELSLDREVVLLRSPEATMPATWGVRNPVVLLPFEAMEWTEERKRVVLLHELAHVKRHDCLTQFVAQLCSAVYWFHPGVWYIARRMRAERELACDEQVLVLGINACDYADHLLQITRAFRSPVGARMAAVAMARHSQLEGRLLAILSGDTEGKKSVSNASRVAVFAVLLAVTLPLAAMRPWKNSPTVAQGSQSGGIALPRLTSAELPASMQSVSDTLRWRGRSFQGQLIEIHANVGDIRAVLTDGNEPWVR
ncbi:MAG: M56 family metallopeptidase, partial [Gemmatimonadaceae bacterium]